MNHLNFKRNNKIIIKYFLLIIFVSKVQYSAKSTSNCDIKENFMRNYNYFEKVNSILFEIFFAQIKQIIQTCSQLNITYRIFF